MTKVHIYILEGCPYCINALKLLEDREVPYEKTVVDRNDTALRKKLSSRSGMNTFPQVFHNEEIIGGYSELSALDQDSGLGHLK